MLKLTKFHLAKGILKTKGFDAVNTINGCSFSYYYYFDLP